MALAPLPGHQTKGPLFARRANDGVRWLNADPSAFKRAQDEDKLVFMQLDRAYSDAQAESDRVFREPDLAQRLNDDYVSVLVDTDEQPEWESLLAKALSVLGAATRRPSLGIFTPQGELFFASGSLPPQASQGPSLRGLLAETLQLRQTQRAEFDAQAERLNGQLLGRGWATPDTDSTASLGSDVIRGARLALARAFDPSFFGFGRGAKLPHAPALEFLLDQASLHKNTEAERMALLSLAAMSSGGMYDQLWGGFFVGTTDRQFHHPLFHKRLGQNSELVRLYLHAFQLTHHEPLRRVATETLTFLTQHFKAPDGGFFLGSYAETPQGDHYLWSQRQLKKALGEPAATHFAHFYGLSTATVTDTPGHLQARRSLSRVASDLGIAEAELVVSLDSSRIQLQELRLRRAGLILDDRLVTADNAATISALSICSLVLDNSEYLASAQQAAARFWSARSSLGLLPRVLGQAPSANLLDHALFLRALIDLHQATLEQKYLDWAGLLSDAIQAHFFRATDNAPEELSCVLGAASLESGADHAVAWPQPLQLLLGLDEDATFGHPAGLLSLEWRRLSALSNCTALLHRSLAIVRRYVPLLRGAPHTACALVRAVDHLRAPALLLQLPGPELERRAVHKVAVTQLSPRALFITESSSDNSLEVVAVSEHAVVGRPTTPGELKEQWAIYEKSVADARRSQLLSKRAPGLSSPAGTRAAVVKVQPQKTVQFQDLSLCRLGLGTYRIGLDTPAHASCVDAALKLGVNVIDTSPSFALGDAQRVVGRVIGGLMAAGTLKREGLFFITKLGLAIAEDAEHLQARSLTAHPPLATVPLRTPRGEKEAGEALKHGAFSLDPEFLSTQITASLDRLGVAQLELCLLNGPEHLLTAGYDQTRLKAALLGAFGQLDQEVKAGRIQGYGLMSNTLTTRGDHAHNPPTALVLEDVLDWVAEQNPQHRLWAIEAPANLVENSAYAPQDHALFRRAKQYGLLTIACRPLSAIVDGALLRLTPPPAPNDGARADQLGAAKYKVAALEAEFETTWAVQLRLAGRAGKGAVLPLSSLASTLESLQTRQQFDHAEATLVTPQLSALLSQLDRAFVGQADFSSFKAKYIKAVAGYLACLREVSSEKNLRLLDQLAARHLSTQALGSAQRERFLSQPWPVRAVSTLLDSDCVDVVLLGMRSEAHVSSVRSLLEWEA